MAILLNQSTLNAYLRHTFAAAPTYPLTLALKVLTSSDTGATQDYFGLTAPGSGQTAQLLRTYFTSNGSDFGFGNRTSAGSYIDTFAGQSNYFTSNLVSNTGATFKNVFIVAPSNSSAWTIYNEANPSGRTFTPNAGNTSEFANCTDLMIGAFLDNAAFSNYSRIAVCEIAVWTDARTSGNYTSYAANTPAETINPGSVYEVWSCDVSGAAGSSVSGTLTGLVNGRTLSITGTVLKAYQTHPVTRTVTGFTAGATLTGVIASGSLQSVMSGFTAGATLGAVLAGGSLGATPGVFVLGPIIVNGVAQAGAALDWVRIYNDAGSVMLYERTGGTLDGTGSTTLTTNTAPPGTAVRIDWQLSGGRRRMPRVTMG